MDIGIIGVGNVGGTLARAFSKAGHKVFLGFRNPSDEKSRARTLEISAAAKAMTVRDAVQSAGCIVLATPWSGTLDLLTQAGPLDGKILIDCTNPLTNDFSHLQIGHTSSGAEQIAAQAKGGLVVKAFNTVGYQVMANPHYGGANATLFLCGDDLASKTIVKQLASEIGFNPLDAGNLIQARLLEPLAMLWIHLALRQGLGFDWGLALLRR